MVNSFWQNSRTWQTHTHTVTHTHPHTHTHTHTHKRTDGHRMTTYRPRLHSIARQKYLGLSQVAGCSAAMTLLSQLNREGQLFVRYRIEIPELIVVKLGISLLDWWKFVSCIGCNVMWLALLPAADGCCFWTRPSVCDLPVCKSVTQNYPI